jgi:hypothetical protein
MKLYKYHSKVVIGLATPTPTPTPLFPPCSHHHPETVLVQKAYCGLWINNRTLGGHNSSTFHIQIDQSKPAHWFRTLDWTVLQTPKGAIIYPKTTVCDGPPVMHDQRDDWDQPCFLLPSDLHLSAAVDEISTYSTVIIQTPSKAALLYCTSVLSDRDHILCINRAQLRLMEGNPSLLTYSLKATVSKG